MYNLYYWKYTSKLMCTFLNYDDCKMALEILKKKHPNAKIWYEPVISINSYKEWCDKFNEGNDIYT